MAANKTAESTICFIGLGLMGSRMAANLIKSGVPLCVHNRTKSKADSLLEAGATWAASNHAAAGKADILFTMLSTPDAVAEAALGDDGFLTSMSEGALWVDCSTVNPSFSKKCAAEAKEKGIRFVDAPVAGSTKPAADGTLIFLVGGEAEDVQQVKPFIDIMGSRLVHVGPASMGTSMKMVVNTLLGVSMASFAEVFNLGQKLGIPRDMLLAGLIPSNVTAPMLEAKKDKIRDADYSPEFPLQWMQKDLVLATLSAYEQGASMPIANAVKEVYADARANGLGELDLSAVCARYSDKK
jgi:3-hydroxyisobutyrate dehydrogenase/glyoxylate/succinic semialdehyde reductase